jgi:hypothetical protein
MRAIHDEAGQATVELIAVLPLIATLAALLWQAALAGQAIWLAGSAARAAARAHAVGADPAAAARQTLPSALERRARIHAAADGSVTVSVAVPAALTRWHLGTVTARAQLAPQRP